MNNWPWQSASRTGSESREDFGRHLAEVFVRSEIAKQAAILSLEEYAEAQARIERGSRTSSKAA